MTTLRQFTCNDLFLFNNVNLDFLTETYNLGFYLHYITTWPDYNYVVNAAESNRMMGYIFGKAEGKGDKWHGHVTAVTVAPEFRRLGMAKRLMNILEIVSEKIYDTYFVDLFVRKSNALAINMYKSFGYVIYRTVLGYYSGEEDAYDMRKALPKDVKKSSMVPLEKPVPAYQLDND
eukprot:TRINITY_DN10942_c0_g1_i2.p1 TRINITY_DN10942_c0_g1~~TRINITY_DN10942_c0_g1_i2.p1  ORF type:complete len:193 (+),score=36.89 TRINITY_DN10942_c0_g1_i2:54-581(+)